VSGNTYSLYVTVRRGDAQRFKEILDLDMEPKDEEDNGAVFVVEEAAFHTLELLELAGAEGLVFDGRIEENYTLIETFSSDGIDYITMDCDNECNPVVSCYETGPDEQQVELARRYWRVCNRAMDELEKRKIIADMERAGGHDGGKDEGDFQP
jgi:hypothetical protein